MSTCTTVGELQALSVGVFLRPTFRQPQPQDDGADRGDPGHGEKPVLAPKRSLMKPVAAVLTAAAIPVNVPTVPRTKLKRSTSVPHSSIRE
jgi:hypothetical protein